VVAPVKKTTTKPGLVLMRTSERSDFKRCQWLWFVRWVLGLTGSRVPTWAWFGTAVHKALEVRYPVGLRRGHMSDVLAAFEEAVDGQIGKIYTEGQEPDEEEVVGAIELGKAMLIGYAQRYGKDQHWQVIHTEQPFQIDVRDPVTGRRLLVYCGTFDMVVYDRTTRRFYIVDHKTRKTFPAVWSFYDLNDQAGSYLWVAPEVLEHQGVFTKKDSKRVEGIVFNALKKALPDERPRNEAGEATNKPTKLHYAEALGNAGIMAADGKPIAKATLPRLQELAAEAKLTVLGEVSAIQPGPLFHRYTSRRGPEERVRQAQHVLNEAKHMNAVRRGKLPILKNKTEECVRCQLFDMCQLDEIDPLQGREYAEASLSWRDPYADHREAMAVNGVTL
jgi:hypothetical protein